MSLWQRLSTLAKAESHGVVETLEDDRLLLRQHLRDAETAVAGKKAKLESMAVEARNLERIRQRLTTRQEELEKDIDLALEQDRDDLARYAIQQLLPTRRRMAEAQERQRLLERGTTELQQVVDDQESRLEELRDRVRAVAEAEHEGSGAIGGHTRATAEEVEIELLRRRSQKLSEAGGDHAD